MNEPTFSCHFTLASQAQDHAAQVIDALQIRLQRHPNVHACYLHLRQERGHDMPPSFVFGFEAEGDIAEAQDEAATVVALVAPGSLVEFLDVDEGALGIHEHVVVAVAPFYRRSWRMWLTALLGRNKTGTTLLFDR